LPGEASARTAPSHTPAQQRERRSRQLLLDEAVGKTFGGVDIANGDDELAPAIALRRHAEG
jgi:hypothetical protein